MADLVVSYPILDVFGQRLRGADPDALVAYDSNGTAEFLNFMGGVGVESIGALVGRPSIDPAAKERARAARRDIVRSYNETAFSSALLDAYEGVPNRRPQ